MRPLGNPHPATWVGEDAVLHVWLSFDSDTSCLNCFHSAEMWLEDDAQRLAAVLTGPVFYEVFRPNDPGVPDGVRRAFGPTALSAAVGLVHAFVTVARRNAPARREAVAHPYP